MATESLKERIEGVRKGVKKYLSDHKVSINEFSNRVELHHWTLQKLLRNFGTMRIDNIIKIDEYLKSREGRKCDCPKCYDLTNWSAGKHGDKE